MMKKKCKLVLCHSKKSKNLVNFTCLTMNFLTHHHTRRQNLFFYMQVYFLKPVKVCMYISTSVDLQHQKNNLNRKKCQLHSIFYSLKLFFSSPHSVLGSKILSQELVILNALIQQTKKKDVCTRCKTSTIEMVVIQIKK